MFVFKYPRQPTGAGGSLQVTVRNSCAPRVLLDSKFCCKAPLMSGGVPASHRTTSQEASASKGGAEQDLHARTDSPRAQSRVNSLWQV